MFEVSRSYANRKGQYIVLDINDTRMTVCYDDGTTAELNMAIQGRIWENIVAERDANESRLARTRRRISGRGTRFYIKPISMRAVEELAVPDWQERVGAADMSAREIQPGDRLIYYAVENQAFFAVATITGASSEAATVDAESEEMIYFFPVDLDAQARSLERAVTLDSVELENHSDIENELSAVDTFLKISEDEFELLTEQLTEVAEEDEEDVDEKDEEDEEGFDE